jgi:hypothetical protein
MAAERNFFNTVPVLVQKHDDNSLNPFRQRIGVTVL